MLESEALKKYCPLIDSAAANHTCCGSKCMGWTPQTKPVENPDFVPMGSRKIGTLYTAPRWIRQPCDPPEGDCGMKPEVYVECGQ